MTFSGDPEIIYITPYREEAPGSAVKLTCVATGIPLPMVSWLDEASEPVDKCKYSEIVQPTGTEAFPYSVASVIVEVGNVEAR